MNLSICICMQIKIALLRNICEVIHDRHAVQQKQDCVLPSHWSVCHEYSLCRTLGAVYRLRHHYYSLDDTANILSFHILSYNLLFLNLWKGEGVSCPLPSLEVLILLILSPIPPVYYVHSPTRISVYVLSS